jgi:hypothetical protein
MSTDEGLRAALNTDRELWREREGDFYSDSIHVTAQGAIGINCGGTVIVNPLQEWFRLAAHPPSERMRSALLVQTDTECDGATISYTKEDYTKCEKCHWRSPEQGARPYRNRHFRVVAHPLSADDARLASAIKFIASGIHPQCRGHNQCCYCKPSARDWELCTSALAWLENNNAPRPDQPSPTDEARLAAIKRWVLERDTSVGLSHDVSTMLKELREILGIPPRAADQPPTRCAAHNITDCTVSKCRDSADDQPPAPEASVDARERRTAWDDLAELACNIWDEEIVSERAEQFFKMLRALVKAEILAAVRSER